MDAISVLKDQHRAVEKLFEQLEKTSDRSVKKRQQIFDQLADELAVHAEVEEKLFYPAAHVDDMTDKLLKALEEHLAAKRLIADLLISEPDHPTYMAKVLVLKQLVESHVEEEETVIFKEARKNLPRQALVTLGERIESMAAELRDTDPRTRVPVEIDAAPELPGPVERPKAKSRRAHA